MARGKPFPKGRSGNPGGRPKAEAEVRTLAQQHGPAVIARLAAIALDKDAEPRASVAAAKELLDRAYGKAPQSVHLSGEVPLTVEPIVIERPVGPPDAAACRGIDVDTAQTVSLREAVIESSTVNNGT